MTAGSAVDFGGGVFVSKLSTGDFAPDPEVPGTEQHVLYAGARLSAGMSRVRTKGQPITWTLPQREFVLVVEGSARIELGAAPAEGCQAAVGMVALA